MYEIFDAIKLEIRKKKNFIRSALNDFKLVGIFLVCDIIECDRVTFVCVLVRFQVKVIEFAVTYIYGNYEYQMWCKL